MTGKTRRRVDVYARIDNKTVKSEGCWKWTGQHNWKGYARIEVRVCGKRKRQMVHRLVLARKLGRDLAPGECACHSCDNRGCLNPDHLWAGTVADNNRDMKNKGRAHSAPGVLNPFAKLTEDQVRGIRAATGSLREIAAIFGTCDTNVSVIRRRLKWKHIT